MGRRLGQFVCIIGFSAVISAVVGCASECRVCDERDTSSYAVTPTLLFGKEPSAAFATRIGRQPWPATAGSVESVQDTIFLEYYRDYFGGNYWSDYNNPQRQFRSYRVGAQQR
jgi:hypothetical protein